MQEDIRKILEYGVMAPSGDNSQPWKFSIENEKEISIYLDPNADNPILNYKLSGTLMAHGALFENIEIAAKEFGYNPEISLFPDNSNTSLVAKIILQKDNHLKKDSLFDFIEKRHTNRRSYHKKKKLGDTEILSLQKESKNKLILVTNKEEKDRLAKVASYMERIALETKELHSLFFKDIFFDKDKNERGENGLYIKTLEVPPPIQLLFRKLKSWSFTQKLNKIGFSKFASKGNRSIYSSSSAIGLLTIDKLTSKSCIETGRVMQRIWLRATKLGLSMQPITGITFLIERYMENNLTYVSDEHRKLIAEAANVLAKNSNNKNVLFMFRIGKSKKPTDVSRRKEPLIIV